MCHQKLLLIAIWVGLISTVSVLGRNFPLQQVTSPECRGIPWEELPENCKINILKEGADPETSKLLFSALRGTSYEHSQEPESGGHPSLDIASSEGTPVYAIQDGIVMKAAETAGYGNSITIKHIIDGKTFYSNYSHLRDILVKVGQSVKGGELIGKVGCTGFTISGDKSRCGYHLDFQITTDKSPSHPYGYYDCPGGYYAAVEQGLCQDKLRTYTIDPLVFFQTYAHMDMHVPIVDTISPNGSTSASIPPNEVSPVKKKTTLEEIYARLRKQNQNILAGNTMKEEVVENNSALTTVDLVGSLATSVQVPETPTEITNTSARVSKFDNYTIQRSRNSDSTDFEVNKVITLTIDITDNFGNPISTVLSYPISLTINQSTIGSVFPNSFSNVINGKKYLFLQTKQLGTATITLWIGGHKLGEEKITVK